MTQDELIIERFCKEHPIKLNRLDAYKWDEPGYVVNDEGRIKALCLCRLGLKKVPEYIAKLSELKILNISWNDLASIKIIKSLSELETLIISYNEITDISVIKGYKKLKVFDASHNPFDDISPIKQLENLETLSLSCNRIEDFTSIACLPSLKEIILSKINNSSNIQFIQNSKDIQSLALFGSDQSKDISTEIFDVSKHLDLSSLFIFEIPLFNTKNVLFPPDLVSLNIFSCNVKDIQFLDQLTKLEILRLSGNEINDIQPVSKLTRLKKITINENQIEDISPLKNLKQLKSINLSGNPITDLQPLLDFSLHFIVDDSDELEGNIYISGCEKITNPPMDIVKQGDEAIRRYFKNIEEEGYEFIYEAKLILVGEGGSGKTSLQKRLKNENALLPKEEERTRGIEVVDLAFEEGKIAHVWDFGGQDVYYPVHRFFITENSVFVLLATTRNESHNFDYWLHTIFQFGGDSPVIIGQTCHDGNKVQWSDVNRYLGNPNFNFNIIKTKTEPYYRMDLPKNNEGLSEIKDIIINQIKGLHHFGKPVPKSWSKVRKALFEKAQSENRKSVV